MENQSLQQAIAKLRAELADAKTMDPSEREQILALISQLEQRIQAAAEPARDTPSKESEEEPGLVDHLRESVEQFEVEHPRVTNILIEIMTSLGGAGI